MDAERAVSRRAPFTAEEGERARGQADARRLGLKNKTSLPCRVWDRATNSRSKAQLSDSFTKGDPPKKAATGRVEKNH